MKLRHLYAAAIAALMVLLSACSGPESPQEVSAAFWDAAVRDDRSDVVRYSTLDSPERYDAFATDWGSYQPKWGRVIIDGNEASVASQLSSPEGARTRSFTTYLVQRDGVWLVDYQRTGMSLKGGVFGDLLSKFDLFSKDLSQEFERSADEAGVQMDQMLDELEHAGKEMSEQASEALEKYSQELQRTMQELDESMQRALEESEQERREERREEREKELQEKGSREEIPSEPKSEPIFI
ncbi:hypothetical protein [uncultured Microbulbifer sp.]|uniref:hypothetical protein n=1 Tax=uncultured Microbulbifer sp. TaxID=348147 RepID=UPI0025EFFEEA|nr:hypothetical protein [uncultured Microbulbifer sp.]